LSYSGKSSWKKKTDFNLSLGRNRWVIYNPKNGLEYDGSMVPAEWFGWLHYKTDFPPTVVSLKLCQLKKLKDHFV